MTRQSKAGVFVPQSVIADGRVFPPPLAAVARRRGIQRTIDRYLDLQTHPSAQAALGHLPEQVMRPSNIRTRQLGRALGNRHFAA